MTSTLTKSGDRELLSRLAANRDDAALQVLIQRYGSMVMRLSARILGNQADAEDAFQATFFALSRSAGKLKPTHSIAGWLHCTAYRTSHKARVAASRRHRHEGKAAVKVAEDPLSQITVREAHDLLDKILISMPAKYQEPLLLCYYENQSYSEAARKLGWPVKLLRSRLEQAKEMLRRRLAAKGLGFSSAMVVTLFSEQCIQAEVPQQLVVRTLESAKSISTPLVGSFSKWMTMKFVETSMVWSLAASFIVLGLGWMGVSLLQAANPVLKTSQEQAKTQAQAKVDPMENAKRIGQAAHAQAALLGKLPRLEYEATQSWGPVLSLKNAKPTIEKMKQGLTDKYEKIITVQHRFCWDEKRVISKVFNSYNIGSATDAWLRSSPQSTIVRRKDIQSIWETTDGVFGTHLIIYWAAYHRSARQEYWWGKPISRTAHTMVPVPTEELLWKPGGEEMFAGEMCEYATCYWKEKTPIQRVWLSKANGRLRGAMGFASDGPNELAQFNDFREIYPKVWIPFEELHVFSHADGIKRSELSVVAVDTKTDLTKEYESYMPKLGELVQDQRFEKFVEYKYDPNMTDADVLKLVAEKKEKDKE